MRKNSANYNMFWELVQFCGERWEIICSPKKVSVNNWGVVFEKYEPKYVTNQKCKRLQEMGYLLSQRNSGFIFTKQAKLYILKEKMLITKQKMVKPWRLYVSFDVPVSNNSDRQRLRNFLKAIGCRKEHGSLWSTDKDIEKYMSVFVKIQRLHGRLKVYIGKSIV